MTDRDIRREAIEAAARKVDQAGHPALAVEIRHLTPPADMLLIVATESADLSALADAKPGKIISVPDVRTDEGWRTDMQNAPGYDGPAHARGLWAHDFNGKPTEFYAAIGYVDEDGDFITGDGPAGWTAMDFDYWMPIPAFPAAPAHGGEDERG